jgi:hypothetical protein
MEESIYQKAYNWAFVYKFEDIEIEYASRLALKMLDDSCKMCDSDRKIFFYIYDAICDREDIEYKDDVNKLILLARDRETILAKPEYASAIHEARVEVMKSTQKVNMKSYKKMVRDNLGV